MSTSISGPPPPRAWARAVHVAAWTWTLVVLVLLWMPPPPPPDRILWWWDLAVHFVLLGTFAGLWTWHGWRGGRLWSTGVVLGAVTEVVQGLLPWPRHSAWDDFGADLLGLLVGWLVARATWPRWNGRRPRWW